MFKLLAIYIQELIKLLIGLKFCKDARKTSIDLESELSAV